MKIDAYAAASPGAPLEPYRYEVGPLGEHEVLVEITHCGVCHSDVHLLDGDWGHSHFPLVPGHEVVGTVAGLGESVGHLSMGERVGIGWQCGSCMECEYCESGDEQVCVDAQATCMGHHGGFARHIVADGRFAFPIPEALDSAEAAPLFCGGITVFAPLRRHAPSPCRVAIVGMGGLGHMAVSFARAMGHEVTVFTSSPDKGAEAERFGAHEVAVSTDRDAYRTRERRFDLVLSTAPADLPWSDVLRSVRPFGKVCLVGVPGSPISLNAPELLGASKGFVGSGIGGSRDIMDMLEFAAEHEVAPQVELAKLADADAAMQRVRDNSVRYRMVLEV